MTLTNLYDESGLTPGILPVQDPSDVADNLVYAAEQHETHEAPCLVSETEISVDDHADTVQGDEGAAGSD